METKDEIVRTVFGHPTCEELDLTLLEDLSCHEVTLIQHDRDETDLIILSPSQMEQVVQWWRSHHD